MSTNNSIKILKNLLNNISLTKHTKWVSFFVKIHNRFESDILFAIKNLSEAYKQKLESKIDF